MCNHLLQDSGESVKYSQHTTIQDLLFYLIDTESISVIPERDNEMLMLNALSFLKTSHVYPIKNDRK